MDSWEETLPNTFARAKIAFIKMCNEDPKFRQEMIEKGVLIVGEEQNE